MADESVAEAPGQESGADEANTGIMTVEDLAATFVERVEGESEAAEPEAGEETSPADAGEESEADVLSQSISEDQEEEAEPEGAEESEPEEEAPPEPKGVSKLIRQVNKLTARAMGSEELVEAMKAEIAELRARPAEQTQAQQGSPALEDVANMQDLEKVRQEALSAKKWALRHVGKEFVEEGEKEYSGDEIRDILAASDEYLTEKIPERAAFLQTKADSDARARDVFDFWDNPESEHFQLYQKVLSDPRYAPLAALPNRDFVMGLIVEGFRSVNARADAKGKPKKAKRRTKAPTSTMEDSVAPPADTSETRREKKRKAQLGTGPVSESQLAAYLTE